jgi:streptogramin lyase
LEYTQDHQWKTHHSNSLYHDDLTFSEMRCAMIDSRGLLWFVNDHWNTPALICYDIENDEVNVYKNFVNQDGTSYTIFYVHCVTEDLEGNIWIGTNQGPFYVDKNQIGQSSITFNQVKVPRNDGSNYADYLLSGVDISSMAIDAGGRKWFGTFGNGVYLISSDNLNQISHFQTNESDILSDNINSIAIDQQKGIVYFATDKGLCSYASDATAVSETMNKDDVYAYPNPVTPDYTGLITVVGLSLNADVKITSSNGALIAEGKSNGGSFTWDGCDKQGRRVASGIYMVITATSDGKKGTVCKIAIIN